MSREPWFGSREVMVGSLCPDCGGMLYRYCPCCGDDMSGKEHGVYQRKDGSMPYPLTICDPCGHALRKAHAVAAKLVARLN